MFKSRSGDRLSWGFSWFTSVPTGKCRDSKPTFKLGYNQFLLHLFQLTIHVSPFNSSPYRLKSKAVPLHAMEALGVEEVQLLLIHDLGNKRGWVDRVTPRTLFTPGEKTPSTHCTWDWVGPKAGLDTKARGKILSPLPEIEPRSPGRPVRSQDSIWTELPRLLIYRLSYCKSIVK
jgi:hypothetical protein